VWYVILESKVGTMKVAHKFKSSFFPQKDYRLVGIIHLRESIKSEALKKWYPCIFGLPHEKTTFLKKDYTYMG